MEQELMQIKVIGENKLLSQMVEDILPTSNITKIENNNKIKLTEKKLNSEGQEFRIVIYKKENIFINLLKNIRFALKKIKIFKYTKEIALAKNNK